MSGTPNQAQIFSQWTAAADILEESRTFADSLAAASGEVDTLEQALHGTYTPELANTIASVRSTASTLVDQSTAFELLEPIMREYAAQVVTTAYGPGEQDIEEVMKAIFEYMHAQTLGVQYRNITHGTPSSFTGTGSGTVYRCTISRYANYELEACHPETKLIRCVADQNTGAKEHAERFEIVGETPSIDAINIAGTGTAFGQEITALHAGTGAGGSLINNASFSTYDASASPKFSKWTETAGGASIAQDTSNTYRSHPGASTDASLQITGGAGTVTLKQTLTNMRVSSLDPDVPYYCRIMVNPDIGTAASGGTVTLRLGSQEVSETVTNLLSAGGWQEMRIGDTSLSGSAVTDPWFLNFNEDPLDLEIEWSSSTSGTIHVDDVILAPMTEVDGTFWSIVGGTTPFLVDDYATAADTGGAAGTGIIQYWLWRSGLGFLPTKTSTPDVTEPT